MDIDDFRSLLENCGVDVWTLIDTAIVVASLDSKEELKLRRDKIVEGLYAAASSSSSCARCGSISNGYKAKHEDGNCLETENNDVVMNDGQRYGGGGGGNSPSTPITPRSDDDGEDDLDPYGGLFDDEQKKVLDIKQQLEDLHQPEESLLDSLQSLADMDITFKALKETDIGRHVNRLRKHSSNDIRRLVKQLVRKWKEIVDEWVKLNPQGDHGSSGLIADGDSPQQKIPHNGNHQVPDFAYSPNPHNVSSGSDRYNSEPERKSKPVPRREAPSRPIQQSIPVSASASVQRQREQQQQKQSNMDSERMLASASKRLQANYKSAENAKKQRTIQVMDIHEIPKPKNTFFAKNKGGGSHGRHW